MSKRMHFIGVIAAFAALALPTGCQDEPTIAELSATYVEQINELTSVVCDCWSEMGYRSSGECTDAFHYVGPAQKRCIDGALERDEEAARTWLECVTALEEELTQCVDQRLTCGDWEPLEACEDDYEIGMAECIVLPTNIQRGIDQCFE